MKLVLPFTLAAALVASHGVAAWGDGGHKAVGYVAMEFLDSNALSSVQSILGSNFSGSLGPAAIWANRVKSQEAFAFTAPFHYITVNDDPPTECSVNLDRDCGPDGCVVTAIQNYTKQLLDRKSMSKPVLQREDVSQRHIQFEMRGTRTAPSSREDSAQTQQALLFITNFIGDIGQPLNVEALARAGGGHNIATTCDGKSTNLYNLWSSKMFTKNVKDRYGGSPQKYASDLARQIKDGKYASEAHGWVSDINQSALSGADVPLTWARDANSLACTFILDFEPGQDLCRAPYYNTAIPVIDRQIAKQGYRLAIWLNTIFNKGESGCGGM